VWYPAGIVAMHRPCNGSLFPGSFRVPVAAYWAGWPFGALLEGLFPWRSRSRIPAAAVLCIAPARYSSLSVQVRLRLSRGTIGEAKQPVKGLMEIRYDGDMEVTR
jgi:hypothetical protein